MSGIDPSVAAYEVDKTKAEADGLTVVTGDSKTLLLDIDSVDGMARFRYAMEFVRRVIGFDYWVKWRSRSGKGWHIKMELRRECSAAERVALQAAMGSDPFREIASIARLHNGIEEPSLLFKPTEEPQPTETPF